MVDYPDGITLQNQQQTKDSTHSYLLDIDALQLKPGSDTSHTILKYLIMMDRRNLFKSSKTDLPFFLKTMLNNWKNIDQSTKKIQSELEKTLKESKNKWCHPKVKR